MKNIEVGSAVWVMASLHDTTFAIVIEKWPDHVRVYIPRYGDRDYDLDQVFHTEEECLAFAKGQSEAVIFACKQQIKNINDLVRVLFSQNIAYCDVHAHWEEIEAARQRAEELLGIELNYE